MAVTAPHRRTSVPGDWDAALPDCARDHAIAALKWKPTFAQNSAAYLAANGVLWTNWVIADRSTNGSIPWPA
jgi:hypothetical protein